MSEVNDTAPTEIRKSTTPVTDVEQWKLIPEWPGYDASDHGNIRTWWGQGKPTDGSKGYSANPRLLRPGRGHHGHRYVILYRTRDGVREKRSTTVNVLVLETFVGPCPPGMEACHRPDTNPENNRLDNLEWDTAKENIRDAFRIGRSQGGGASKVATVSKEQVIEIWGRLVAGAKNHVIARDLGISTHLVCDIKTGRTWAYLTDHLEPWPMGRKRRVRDKTA